MAWAAALAFAAGIVTILSPCVLPLLPMILFAGVGEGRARPLGVVLGFVGAFSAAVLGLATLVQVSGIPPDAVRWASAALLAAFGLVLVVPALKRAYEAGATAAVASWLPEGGARRSGLVGGLGLGVGLGLVWTPCVGPVMASVITLAMNQRVDTGAVAVTAAFAAGTALPMLLVMRAGRALVRRLGWVQANAGPIQRAFGVVLVLTAASIAFGGDRLAQAALLERFPGWDAALTGWEPAP